MRPKQKESDVALSGGVLLVTTLPFAFKQTVLTNLLATAGGFVFLVGLIYWLLGGRRLFTAARNRWPRACYYMSAVGWMPYMFAAVLLSVLGISWYWPAVGEFDVGVIVTAGNIAFAVWIAAGMISLYRAWRNRRASNVFRNRDGDEKAAAVLKKQTLSPKRRKDVRLIAVLVLVTAPLWLGAGALVSYFFDNDLYCKDQGMLWDRHQRRCRTDCPVLIYPHGCVFLPPAHQAVWEACVGMPQTAPWPTAQPCDRHQMRQVLFELCTDLNGIWDDVAGACDFWG